MVALPGQFMALQAFNAFKEAISGYVMHVIDLIKILSGENGTNLLTLCKYTFIIFSLELC